MHRFPHWPGFDILCLECEAHCFAIGSKFIGIDENARQPTRASIPRRLGHELDPRKVGECPLVEVTICASGVHALFQHEQLATSDSGENIAHPVIESDLRMLVMRCRIPRLCREESCLSD